AEARARGHHVTAGVRSPERHRDLDGAGVDLVRADALDASQIAVIAPGHDAAINATRPNWQNPPDYFVRMNAALVRALESAAVPRLMLIGGAGTLTTPEGVRLADTPGFPQSARPRAVAQQRALAELHAGAAPIDWVYLVPPPRCVADGPRTGTYRHTASTQLADLPSQAISYADFAVGLLDEFERPRYQRLPVVLTG